MTDPLRELIQRWQGLLRLNAEYRDLLSNDLGAMAGLLFDVGIRRYKAPPPEGDEAAFGVWQADLERVRAETELLRRADEKAREGEHTHTQVQAWLRDLGIALGFDVWVAANDRGRAFGTGMLGDGCRESVISSPAPPFAESRI